MKKKRKSGIPKGVPTKLEIALPYVQKYPSFPSLTLARLVYSENKSVWPTLDACSQSIRAIRGKKGKKTRNTIDSVYAPFFDKEERSRSNQPLTLPETWAHKKEIYKLPTGNNKIGFISDLQVPFQDNASIEAAYAWLKKSGINTIFINGDWIDFYGISSFQRDPRRRDFNHEYYCILQSFEHLRYHFPNIDIFYNLNANHEIRYEKYMSLKAPELLKLELPEYSIDSLLRLKLYDIRPILHADHVLIGKLPVVHGHTIFQGQTSPVSTARTVFMKTKQSAIASHCHQTSEYTTKKLNGEIITCWTNGCLMDLNVEYNPHNNNYNHGFARIETDSSGNFQMENKRIFEGKVL